MSYNKKPKIGYLINQYPKISHTFIRREILALEALGLPITRISIRESTDKLCDVGDQREKQKTTYILSKNLNFVLNLFASTANCLPRIFPAIATTLMLMRRSGSIIKPIIYLLEACWLYRFCSSKSITHIHAHFGTNTASVAMLCHKLNGPAFSLTIHGPEEFDSPLALALDKKIEASSFVVAISSFCRSQLFRWTHPNDWTKIVDIRCTVDDDFMATENGALIERKRFLTIGRLCEQKGYLLLLQAFSLVIQRHPDACLHIIGDGELRTILEDFIQAHKMCANVRLHGWQDAKQISTQIDSCSAMILPSFAEGLPVVIMEALARRRPVLSTYIAAIPELVDERCGWLIPAGDVNALRDAILEVVNTSPEKLYEMGNHGHARVRMLHSSDAEAKKLKIKLMQPIK